MLSDDGRLIGIPRPSVKSEDGLEKQLLKRPDELETPLAHDAATALLGPGGGATFRLRYEGFNRSGHFDA